jgi:hypothetical protein
MVPPIVAFIQSLDRPQENQLFSQDIALTHPGILEQYSVVCPRRMDLGTMKAKAMSRHSPYKAEDNYQALSDDLELMVSNCLRFNHDDPTLCKITKAFHEFAIAAFASFLESQKLSAPVSSESKKSTPLLPTAASVATLMRDRSRHIESFVRSLDRLDADEGIFSSDVLVTHPHLRESYEAVCPQRTDLGTMAKQARQGRYSSGAAGVALLEQDIHLIANNCITFNGAGTYYGEIADSFKRFALGELEKHRSEWTAALASEDSSSTRASKKIKLEPESGKLSESSPSKGGGMPSQPAVGSTQQQQQRSKQERQMKDQPPLVVEIVPLPHQQPLEIPPGLRAYLVASHLQSTSLRCRFPCDIPASKVLSAFLESIVSTPSSDSGGGDQASQLSSSSSDKQHAMRAIRLPTTLRGSYHFLAAQTVGLISRNFDLLFPKLLLYASERADVFAFLSSEARREVHVGKAKAGPASLSSLVTSEMEAVPWSSIAGAQFLVRFLVHLPQLGYLAATSSTAPASLGDGHNHRRADAVVETAMWQVSVVSVVVEDILNFVDANREALLPPVGTW